jgi:hypothetical protein
MPRNKLHEIHSDFTTTSGVWITYRAEITGFYNTYNRVDLDDHVVREFNKKIRDLGQPESLYIAPYDGGLRYIGNGTSFS